MADSGKDAPQPGKEGDEGATAGQTANTGDSTMIFLVGMGHFFSQIFRISLLAYFFWSGVLYVIGATLMVVGFLTQSPTIQEVPACPAKQSAYLFTALWFLLGGISLATAYGYTAIEQMEHEDFEHISLSIQILGFFTKVVPTWSRLIHVFTLCQLNTIALMLFFLPECNRTQLAAIVAFVLLVWWIQIFFGIWAKRSIFIPPFLYEPPKPGRNFLRELHVMMRSWGP